MTKNYMRFWKGVALSGLLHLLSGEVSSQNIFGLTSADALISFSANTPQVAGTSLPITGLTSGQTVVGMDVRPNTGEIYILGYDPYDFSASLYTLNKSTAVASRVGTSLITLNLGDGSRVGFDFNPTVDRIRVVSATNKSYRLNPINGSIAFTDGDLRFAPTDINAGKNPNAAASAYSNSYIGSGTTVLYNFDDSLNIFTRQDPPNDGIQNTIGASGITLPAAGLVAGFDIYKDPATLANLAYLSLGTAQGTSSLYRVNLVNGATTLVGQIGTGVSVKDIAFEIERPLPLPTAGQLVYALQGAANLISFDSENPRNILNAVPISGLPTTQVIVGMDMRPSTRELYILGYNAAGMEGQLYKVAPATGVATPIGTAPIMLMLGTRNVGFDFNPLVDRIRVVNADNNNLRLHPETGAVVFQDTALAYASADVNAGKNPFVTSVAYTNSYRGTVATQLYGYDDSLNVFVLQNPPNRGTLNTSAQSRLVVNTDDPSTDLDVYYDQRNATNIAYLVANTGNSTSDSLYTVNLTTGALVAKGQVGLGVAVRDITVAIDTNIVTSVVDINGGHSNANVQVFPNPLADETSVKFELSQPAEVSINVVSMLGATLFSTGAVNLPSGHYTQSIATADLPKGLYLFEIKIDGVIQNAVKAIK